MLYEALLVNTSMAHTKNNTKHISMNDARYNIKERELEKVDQTQTHGYVSRFEHTTLHPRLHTEGFPLTRLHRTSHTGNLY